MSPKTTLFYVAISSFLIIGSVNAQKIATVQSLNKFQHTDLYVPTANYQLSGTWKGEEIQYDYTHSFITNKYQYELTFEQVGNKIIGTSFILDEAGNYGEMKIRGVIIGDKLHFEEYEITDEQMQHAQTVWCFTTGGLDIVKEDGKWALKGNLDGYSADNYRTCESTSVYLQASPENVIEAPGPATILEKAKASAISIQTFPNPFVESVSIEYRIPEDGKVLIEIFDLQGKKVSTVVNSDMKAGSYKVSLEKGAFEKTSGVYLLKMNINNQEVTKQFVQSK